jgi:hypothetical protein
VPSICSLVTITHLHSSTIGYLHRGVDRRRRACAVENTTKHRGVVVWLWRATSVGVGGREFDHHGQPFFGVVQLQVGDLGHLAQPVTRRLQARGRLFESLPSRASSHHTLFLQCEP